MGYWKSKVLPKIKKVFEKNGTKKTAAAAEACKSFDDSKEDISKEFDEKKTDLQPKVIEIYKASSAEIKSLVKEPNEAGLKKHSTSVQKFLGELVKVDFPGSKPVFEASSKYGAASVPGPVFFVFEKVSSFIVTEDKAVQLTATEAAETKPEEEATASGGGGVKEIVVEEDKEEVVVVAEASAPAPADEPGPAAEPPKP